MAKVYPLQLIKADDLILADAVIKNHTASLVIDTGATNTVIDLNTLLIGGVKFKPKGRKKFETASGIIEADMLVLEKLSIWGRDFNNITVYTLDFIAAGILSPYEGVVGLDILQNFMITLDFPGKELRVK